MLITKYTNKKWNIVIQAKNGSFLSQYLWNYCLALYYLCSFLYFLIGLKKFLPFDFKDFFFLIISFFNIYFLLLIAFVCLKMHTNTTSIIFFFLRKISLYFFHTVLPSAFYDSTLLSLEISFVFLNKENPYFAIIANLKFMLIFGENFIFLKHFSVYLFLKIIFWEIWKIVPHNIRSGLKEKNKMKVVHWMWLGSTAYFRNVTKFEHLFKIICLIKPPSKYKCNCKMNLFP